MKSGETGKAVSEKKTFKDFMILYLYIAHGQGQTTPGCVGGVSWGEGAKFYPN